MNRLWAPWRIAFIANASKKSGKKKCVFCVGRSKRHDRRRYIVDRYRESFSILNIYPYNNGHIMIAPYRHCGEIEDLKPAEINDMMLLVVKTKKLLDKHLKPHGYNIGFNAGKAGGAGITGHIHLHIVPRWIGDTNFMTVISDTKVIPESLRMLYCKLRK